MFIEALIVSVIMSGNITEMPELEKYEFFNEIKTKVIHPDFNVELKDINTNKEKNSFDFVFKR